MSFFHLGSFYGFGKIYFSRLILLVESISDEKRDCNIAQVLNAKLKIEFVPA